MEMQYRDKIVLCYDKKHGLYPLDNGKLLDNSDRKPRKKNPDNRNSSTEDPDIDMLVIWKCKGPRIARILWEKKSKVGGLILPDIKTIIKQQ